MAFYEPGAYECEIVDQVLTTNSKENDEFQLTVKPLSRLRNGEAEEVHADYNRTIYLTMTEATMGTAEQPGWVWQTLTYLGFTGESFTQLDKEHESCCSFIGLKIECSCTHETYHGKTREKWTVKRNSSGGSTAKPSDKKRLKALDGKFKGLLKSNKDVPKEGLPARMVADTANGTMEARPSGDDIPF